MATAALTSLGGAMVGQGIYMAMGGDDFKGAAVGAMIGLGAGLSVGMSTLLLATSVAAAFSVGGAVTTMQMNSSKTIQSSSNNTYNIKKM